MTTIVKKRLQAVVALLVCFMVLFAALPVVPFTNEVQAVDCYIYFDQVNDSKHKAVNSTTWSNLDESQGSNGAVWLNYWGGSGSSAYSGRLEMEGTTSGDWRIIGVKLDLVPANIQFIVGNSNSPTGDGYYTYDVTSGVASGNVYRLSDTESNADTKKVVEIGETGKTYTLNSEATPDPPADTTKRAYLAGVNYFNYFYDEQVVYGEFGIGSSQADQVIDQGQAKAPYIYFNRAIMANSSYINATDEPMYLGEFWIGGGAENVSGNYNGQDYDSATAANVKAGQYARNCGVTGPGNQSLGAYHTVPNTTLTKFTWGANLAFRGNEKQSNFHVVATGLVDDTLSLDPTDPNYLTPTKNGARIPYFDKNWVNNTTINNLNTGAVGTGGSNHIGKVYTSTFPFYYDQTVSLTAKSNLKDKWQDSYVYTSGDNYGVSLTSNSNITLNCYKFDSLTDTVKVNKAGGMAEQDDSRTVDYSIHRAELINELPRGSAMQLGNIVDAYMLTTEGSTICTAAGITTSSTIGALAAAISAAKSSYYSDAEMSILDFCGYFDVPGKVMDVDGKPGFFPFNNEGDKTEELEYGFGVRLDIKFNIVENGTEDGTNGGVPQIFRFTGDDDVWVFIDGKLALDMGGGHKNAIGEINFKTGQTAVLFTGSSSDTTIKEDWDETGDGTKRSDVTKVNTATGSSEIGSILSSIKAEANAGAGGTATVGSNTVNISNEHTLTFFYMERGKLNSNMSLMFNFIAPDIVNIEPGQDETFPTENPDPPAERKFSVREVTNFDHINPGLLSATKLIAEDDAFKYTIQNNTYTDDRNNASKWGSEQVLVPTKDVYNRTVTETIASTTPSLTTKLTDGSSLTPDTAGNYVYLDLSSASNAWKSNFVGAYVWGNTSGTGSNDYHMQGVSIGNDLYKFTLPGDYPYTNIKFVYTDSGWNLWSPANGDGWFKYGGDNYGFNNQNTAYLSYTGVGHVYKITTGNTTDDGSTVYVDPNKIKNFAGSANVDTCVNVADTGYIWKDDLAVKASGTDEIDGMTNQTSANGEFGLMYGTGAKESSATFVNQFMTSNWDSTNNTWTGTGSTVKVQQTLVTPKKNGGQRGTDTTDAANIFYTTSTSARAALKAAKTTSTSARSMDHLYTSSATLVDNTNTLDQTVINYGSLDANGNVNSGYGVPLGTYDMTLWVSNTPNVADIVIHKTVTESGQEITTSEGPFTIKIQFTKIFGENVGTNGAHPDYDKMTYYLGTGNNVNTSGTPSGTMTKDTYNGMTYGTVQLMANQTLVLKDIPIDSICNIYEVDSSRLDGYKFTTGSEETYLSYSFEKDNAEGRVTVGQVGGITGTYQGDNGSPMAQINLSSTAAPVSVTVANVKKPTSDGEPDNFNLELKKIWTLTDANQLTEQSVSSVKYILERTTDNPPGANTNWTTVIDGLVLSGTAGNATYGGGLYTVTTVAETKTNNNLTVTWKATINNLPARDGTSPYTYRIREYGKGDTSIVLLTGGAYSANCVADYSNNSMIANSTGGMTKVTANNVDTWTMTLSIGNVYSASTTVSAGMPKTGARGVYAIVTFGAFAITIAGVALLIYRKKLQTVNIYAVKGSEKPKE